MKFIYLDPGITTNHGHHANSCLAITRELAKRRIETRVYAHRDIEDGLRAELSASPHFESWLYWGDREPLCGWLKTFTTAAATTCRDIAAIKGITSADIVYLNSALPGQFMGLLNWLSTLAPADLPTIIVEFGHGPGIDPVGRGNPRPYTTRDPRCDAKATLYRYAATAIPKAAKGKLHPVTFEPYCSQLYAKLVQWPVATLPALIDRRLPLRQEQKGTRQLTIGILGTQRPEKGYHLVPDIARSVLRQRDVRFFIHNSGPTWMPAEQEALKLLASESGRIQLDEGPADGENWPKILIQADIILCPYDPLRYHGSYSAVAVEACAYGIPFVGPADTSIHRLIEQGQGSGGVFDQQTVELIVAATLDVIDRFPMHSAQAIAAAESWSLKQGAKQTVDAMLALANNTGSGRPLISDPADPGVTISGDVYSDIVAAVDPAGWTGGTSAKK